MHNIMLFGAGWEGDVRDIEEGLEVLHLFPRPEFVPLDDGDKCTPNFREVLFRVSDFSSANGRTYLIGTVDDEPTPEMIERTIFRNKPTPI